MVAAKDPSSEYKVQYSTTLKGGDLVNLRGQSFEEVEGQAKEFNERIGNIVEYLNGVRQVVLADAILSDPPPKVAQSTGKVQDLPPSQSESFVCSHGPMKDLTGKRNKQGQLYRNTHYCAAPQGEEQCKARGSQ